jgi:hypothetical protein
MDNYFKNDATKDAWDLHKQKECFRAYEFCKTRLKTPLSLDEFKEVWYSEHTDKKGINHLANMLMSIFQSRKAAAGKTFETAIYNKHNEHGITILNQKYVDKDGNIYNKKPTKISVHKVDGLIPIGGNSGSICDMFVITIKTTIRERVRQDNEHAKLCKRLILLTREMLTETQVANLIGYGYTCVFPFAENTEFTWSYDKYFSEIKRLQN